MANVSVSVCVRVVCLQCVSGMGCHHCARHCLVHMGQSIRESFDKR